MKKIIIILALLVLFGIGDVWGIGGGLNKQFGAGDSADFVYYCYNCYASKKMDCDSVRWLVSKDTLGNYSMGVDSGKVTPAAAPSYITSLGRGDTKYILRMLTNAGNHQPGRYTMVMEAWGDSCSTPFEYWWTVVDTTDQTFHALNYKETMNLPDDPADDSDMDTQLGNIQTEVDNLDGASMLTAPATAHAAYETLFVHKADFHSSGDTNTKDMGDTLTLIMAEILNLDAWNPANGVLCWIDGDSLYTLTVKADSLVLAITDVNKANFKASGFASPGDPVTLQGDSLYTLLNNLIAFKDSVENAILAANKANFMADTSEMKTMMQRNWDPDTDGEFSVEAGAGGADTSDIKAMMQKNWDPDTDGELSVETSTGADSSVMKKMMQNNWDTDTDGLLSVEADACAGSGARTVIIWVKDITDSTGIPGFEIDIEDSIGGGGVYGNTTNPSGCCTLSLDDATWTIHLQKVPYSITSPVYETISGNTTLTYYATPFTPGSPPADSLCVVYGYVKKSNGTPYVGAKVEMWMDVYPVTFGGILIDVVTKQVVYTNTAGRFEFSDGVYYSSSLNPSNLKWKVRIKTTNWLWEGRVIVPSQASWEIEIPDL